MPKLTCVLNINVETDSLDADAFRALMENNLLRIRSYIAQCLSHRIESVHVPMCFPERFEGKETP